MIGMYEIFCILTFGNIEWGGHVLVQHKSLILRNSQVPNLNLFYSTDLVVLSLLFIGKELAAVFADILEGRES